MEVDWLNVWVRFALYLDLMLLFGLPLFALYALRKDERGAASARCYSGYATMAALIGLVLSVVDMAVVAKAMTGVEGYADRGGDTVAMIATETAFGIACFIRMSALLGGLLASFALAHRPTLRYRVLVVCGAIALATLAWGGHGAMNEGLSGVAHLLVDIAHLLAGGAWIGALAGFLMLARMGVLAVLDRAARGFAGIGTVIVGTLVTTGAVNYWFIAGMPTLERLTSPYGRILLVKLALFAAMLVMAALNRYRLGPALATASDSGAAVRALRRSFVIEALLGVAVLAIVAVLGVQSPEP
ncbi:copper homeostasis membrane protein CopD [Cupriavidus metallidurans]|uniref:copper homeostasis membrane protein CopD n=1 Tax=Cupriavidus TaxID=106589 RepID=UPI000E94F0C5|nr:MULTISPECIES: copper homeostasis membrane protein CopD [unclassified Cupriavidus]GMG92874.1 copper resistance protein CopD [Cupriavidus sp. TKC]HBD34440.1 copper resistance protein CopD [Cupriavidus sp.]HBO82188.1 copper resistance protein CopD [Cupriavidus sp.]